MSTTIDQRVVEMRFDNKQFKNGARDTMDSLSQLKKGLKLDGATRGLNEIDGAAKRISFSGIQGAVDNLASKFDLTRVLAIGALTAIAAKAAQVGIELVKSLTITPVMEGLREYETNLNSIQTILSNTQWEKKDLEDVNGALSELNEYSDQTIYNFSEMARNIGTFTAAGVGLDTATGAIKGIANLAAVSGSNSQQASTAMYQLSQALSTGSVKLMDWNSVVNAGMGGKVFQDAVKDTARNHGVAIDDIIDKNGSFRDSLQEGWFTTEILTETLSKFTGDLTEEQIKALGYTDKQVTEIMKLGVTAKDAATKIKTVSQLVGALQESAGSGWAQTWQIIFGDFEEAKELWTGVNDVIGGFINANAESRNKVLGDWKELGGRTALIQTVENAFSSLMSVIAPLKKAFTQIFPAVTGKQLYDITIAIRDFFATFKMEKGGEAIKNLQRVFTGFFAILSIGWEFVKAGTVFLFKLFKMVFAGSGSFLEAAANVADFFVNLQETIKKGDTFTKFFDTLIGYIEIGIAKFKRIITVVKEFGDEMSDRFADPIERIKEFGETLRNLFNDRQMPDVKFDDIAASLKPVEDIGDRIAGVWDRILEVIGNVRTAAEPIIRTFTDFFSELGTNISDSLSELDVDYSDILGTINTALFGGLVVLIKGYFSKGGEETEGFAETIKGAINGVKGSFEELTTTLSSMQNTLRAATLLQIAAAVGILTASVVSLSKLDREKLAQALAGLAAVFLQLFAALAGLKVVGGPDGLIKTSAGLVLFAIALRILVTSVKAIADLSWEEMARGLAGTTGLIAALVVAVKLMSGKKEDMIKAGAGLMLLAIAIKILVSSVKDFAEMEWEEIKKGLTGVAALLVALALFTKFSETNKGALGQGAGIILLALGIKILASAVEDFAAMEWEDIQKGLASVTAILAAFAIFSRTAGDPAKMMASGVALILVGAAMKILASAMADFAEMEWEEIGKGLAAMAGALLLIVGALTLMPPTVLASAAALVVVAYALGMIVDVMLSAAGMSWEEIGKGLGTLAGALLIIAAAMFGMVAALPGAAALLIVAGALAIFLPVLTTLSEMSWQEILTGLGALAGVFILIGVAGALLTPVIPSLLGLGIAIGLIGIGLALAGGGVFLFATGLTLLAAAGAAGTLAIVNLLTAIGNLLPFLGQQLGIALITLIEVIASSQVAMTNGMTAIFGALIDAAAKNIPKFIDLVGDLVLKVVEKFEEIAPQVADSVSDATIRIMDVLQKKAPVIIAKFTDLVVSVLEELEKGVPKMADAATDLLVQFIESVGDSLDDVIDAGAEVLVELINGISENIDDVIDAGGDLIVDFIEGISDNMQKVVDAGIKTVIEFVNGVADSIESNQADLEAAGRRLASAIVSGMTGGLTSMAGGVADKAAGMARGAYSAAKRALGIDSPSKEFHKLGRWTAQGFINGMVGSSKDVIATWTKTMDMLKDGIAKTAKQVDKHTAKLKTLDRSNKNHLQQIYKTTTALVWARTENRLYTEALKDLKSGMSGQRTELVSLGNAYDTYSKKIERANNKLKDAINLRTEYRKSIEGQFEALPAASQDSSLKSYTNDLKYANADVEKFTGVLRSLNKMGLSDRLYKDFMAKGTDILPFLEELEGAGPKFVRRLNSLSGDLKDSAHDLGLQGGRAMYNAGVDAAKGLVNGLESKRRSIEIQMTKIARSVVRTLRKQLKMHSPSRVMESLGGYTVEGMANGIAKSAPLISKAAEGIGDSAINTMKRSLSNISDLIDIDADLSPTITPVLDLSSFEKEASKIDNVLSGQQINIDAIYSQAKYASMGYQANVNDAQTPTQEVVAPSTELTFNQYNNSPKALTSAEIYRQTQNQLSLTKGALTPNATSIT